jgi:hypothetical protein
MRPVLKDAAGEHFRTEILCTLIELLSSSHSPLDQSAQPLKFSRFILVQRAFGSGKDNHPHHSKCVPGGS